MLRAPHGMILRHSPLVRRWNWLLLTGFVIWFPVFASNRHLYRASLQLGEQVRIHGLKKATKFNGQIGTITRLAFNGKVGVQINVNDPKLLQRVTKNYNLKRANLLKLDWCYGADWKY